MHERASSIGGRMRTQEVDGFLLDHGFHVMQTGYSISESEIDFAALGARAFSPGAGCWSRGQAVELSPTPTLSGDPLEVSLRSRRSAGQPPGSLACV